MSSCYLHYLQMTPLLEYSGYLLLVIAAIVLACLFDWVRQSTVWFTTRSLKLLLMLAIMAVAIVVAWKAEPFGSGVQRWIAHHKGNAPRKMQICLRDERLHTYNQ